MSTQNALGSNLIVGKFAELVQQGLVTFDSLGHTDNAIPLCPLCHRNFDDINRPGFLFIPSDLQYFIDYERMDFDRRTIIATTTTSIPPRSCPTPKMYFEHQLLSGDIQQGACGGKYVRYTLRDYFPKLGQNDWIPGRGPFQDAEPWHGAPSAALRRAFQVLGDPLVHGIPEEDRQKLRELQDLYMKQIRISSTSELESSDIQVSADPDESQGDDPAAHAPDASSTGRIVPTGSLSNTDESQIPSSLGHSQDLQRCTYVSGLRRSCGPDGLLLKRHIPPITSDRLLHQRPRTCQSRKLWRWGPRSSSHEKAIWYSVLSHG